MKLLIVSDLHLEFGAAYRAPENGYDVAIIAGDIDVPAAAAVGWARRTSTFPHAKGVIFVPGNHEFYGHMLYETLDAMHRAAAGSFVHALDCADVAINGVRFLGCTLWTDFRLQIDSAGEGKPVVRKSDPSRAMAECSRFLTDYRAVRVEDPATSNTLGSRRLEPSDTLKMHRAHRRWLRVKLMEPFEGPTVVVTHHAPDRRSLAPRYREDWVSAGFVSELPATFFDKPVLWVHGHTHSSFDYRVRNCRVICNPRGYMDRDGSFENAEFKPGLIVEV
jgi:hypothetical protein